jgi:hypothetical protein
VCDPAIMPNIDDEIRARTASFANDITVLVRQLALESVSTALGQSGAPASPSNNHRSAAAPARPARSAPAPRAAAKAAPPARAAVRAAPPRAPVSRRAASRRTPGEKRPPAELARLTEKLHEYIKANAGRRMEVITKALGTPTRDLNLPIKKLLAAKKIRAEGHKRATEYFPL